LFLKKLSSILMVAHARIWPNYACDDENEDIIERAHPYFDTIWSGDYAESWLLEFLAVHPSQQGQGLSRRLVEWGLYRAQEEGISASVISSHGKEGFYQSVGLDTSFGNVGAGDGNPLADVKGGNVYWRMPFI
jgi:GNAT superfamily N-acetyltransferase